MPGVGGAAGGDGTGHPGAAGPTAGPRGPSELTATDQGVTARTIKLGVVLLDIRALEPLGFAQPHFSPEEQRQQFQVFLDDVNARGGILGRRLEPVFVTWDPLDSNGERSGGAVCVKLAENERVFAAIGFTDGVIAQCLTTRYGIPAVANLGQLDETYRKGRHLLLTPFASLERGARDWGTLVVRAGVLAGRRTATVYMDIPAESRPEQALVGALQRGASSVTYRAQLASDPASAQGQLPVEIQQMKAAGVSAVFLSTNFIMALQFAQTAEQQGFRPLYLVSDLGSLTVEGLVRSMPTSFHGAFGFTQRSPGSPEPAQDRVCRTHFNRTTKQSYAAGNEAGGVRLICFMVRAVELAGKEAGQALTRTRLGLAFQRMGARPMPFALPGSFRPGKTDYADQYLPVRYARACRCYQVVGRPQQPGDSA